MNFTSLWLTEGNGNHLQFIGQQHKIKRFYLLLSQIYRRMLLQGFVKGLGKYLIATLSLASITPGALCLLFPKCLGSQFLSPYWKINLFSVVYSNWFLICCSVRFCVGIHTLKRDIHLCLFISSSKWKCSRMFQILFRERQCGFEKTLEKLKFKYHRFLLLPWSVCIQILHCYDNLHLT